MPYRLPVPKIARRYNRETAYGPLPALLVAIEKVESEWFSVSDRVIDYGTQRIVSVANGRFPVASPAGGDIKIEPLAPKIAWLGMDVAAERLFHDKPTVDEGNARTHVAQAEGQIDHMAFLLDDRPTAFHSGDVSVAPECLVHRVSGQGWDEERAQCGEK
jgi:hypothetical protein